MNTAPNQRIIQPAQPDPAAAGSGPTAWRAAFPILDGDALAYLDSAATTHKPLAVMDAIQHWYRHHNANVHRGAYRLATRATDAYGEARERLRRFINAASTKELIFVRGTTEGINLVAQSFVAPRLNPGDNLVITALEHHANLLPWQRLCQQRGAELRVIPINDRGELELAACEALLDARTTRILALTHISNALGTVNPVAQLTALAHERGIPVLVDGAQAVAHRPVDVQALDCDFYAFSGHKLYGPSGIGVLYGKETLLESMDPYQSGGAMVRSVSFEAAVLSELPQRFEAGTPNIEGAIGLAAAVDFIEGIGFEALMAHEAALLQTLEGRLGAIDGVRILSRARDRSAICAFELAGVHPHDLATIADASGVAIRAGHHCAMPLMQCLGVTATARASLGCYNSFEDVERLTAAVETARGLLG